MDEEFDTSVDTSDVDTSADMDTSDVVDNVPEDIPEDIPEDEMELPEEDDLSEDIPEDIPEDEPELAEEDDLSEDIPEDVPEDETELAEEDDLSEDIPEDVPEDELELSEGDDLSDDFHEDVPEEQEEVEDTSPDETETQDEPMDDVATDEATEDTTSDVDSGDSTEPTEDTEDEPMDNISTDEAAEDIASDVNNGDTSERSEDTQTELMDDAATDETAEDTTFDVDNGDFAEHNDDAQKEAVDDSTNTSLNDADDTNEFSDGTQEDPSKVLKRDELDLLKSGNDAINQRLEVRADDYRDKGMSEDEIRDRLAADKRSFQKEFLEDAFPGQDVSPNVFNGLSENGAKDRLADIEHSDTLRNQLKADEENSSLGNEWGDDTNPSVDAKDDIVDDKTKLANDIMRDYNVGKADFADFDPAVAVAVSDAIKDAKSDFPDLDVKYIGSIDTQVNGIKDELTDFYRKKFQSIPNSGLSKEQIERAAVYNANKFITGAKLNETNGTFAWSLNIPDAADPTGGGLSKYNGVAINKDYASDNAKFTAAKVREVATKHKPIGCDTPRATVDHELGHEIDKLLGAKNDPEINKMYSEMMQNGNAESQLSGYSKENIKEFIAECYSEYRNNPQPREYSTKVYQRLKYLYDQRRVN